MPEHIRALVVIIFLAYIGFYFAKKVVTIDVPYSDFKTWRNIWLIVTVVTFLSHNFWIYVFISSVLIIKLTKNVQNKLALFFILLFVIPPVEQTIPGFGLMNYLFTINHIRLIILLVLLPAAVVIASRNKFTFGKTPTDKLIIIYAFVIFCIQLRDRTVTDALRYMLYSFIEIFLPYYVASRSIKDMNHMNTAMHAFITSAMVIAMLAIFEYSKRWLLYNPLPAALSVNFDYGNYLGRGSDLRAIASLSHPIVLGYFFAVALCFYLYISTTVQSKLPRLIGWALILLGLLAALSRGPWIGAIASSLFFIILGKKPLKKIGSMFLICLVATPFLMGSAIGNKIFNLIPFVGKTDNVNVEYREKLFQNSMIVINKNPLFGSDNWQETPEMIAMIQGEGIIDVVNSYIAIALGKGYVGLVLFVLIFISVIFAVLKKIRRLKDKNSTQYILGASLVSAIIAIMVIITTTSAINTIPIVFWTILGMGVAFTKIENDPIKY